VKARALALTLVLVIAGCAATPSKPRNSAGVLFNASIEATQKAAMNALIVNGFEVTLNEPLHLQGFKGRSVGVVFTTGGETVGIWLEPIGATRTKVIVTTRKSLVNKITQRIWNEDLLVAMELELGRRQ